MKITKQRLREIIKEELTTATDEPVTDVAEGLFPDKLDTAPRDRREVMGMIKVLETRIARIEKELGKPWDPAAAEAYAVDVEE
jgi:hypothetical protein